MRHLQQLFLSCLIACALPLSAQADKRPSEFNAQSYEKMNFGKIERQQKANSSAHTASSSTAAEHAERQAIDPDDGELPGRAPLMPLFVWIALSVGCLGLFAIWFRRKRHARA